jgi:hypothetical protein
MTLSEDQQTVLMIKGAISEFPAEQLAQFNALYSRVGQLLSDAPDPLGTFCLALLGAELQAKSGE